MKYHFFCHFRGSRVLHTLWPPFEKHFKYVNLAEDLKKAIPQKLGDLSELNFHDGLKTGLLQTFCRNQKITIFLSRKFAGISRKFAGISRKFADIFFNHFKTNISSMCGHGPRISRTCLLFFSTESIPRIHGAQTYQRRGLWGAAIWQNHLSHLFCFIAVFVFHRVFSNQNCPSRFFCAFGFRR